MTSKDKGSKKDLLRTTVGSLKLSEPIRLNHIVTTNQQDSSLDEARVAPGQKGGVVATSVPSGHPAFNPEETGANRDTVTSGQSHPVTLSKAETVRPRQCQEMTEPRRDPVTTPKGDEHAGRRLPKLIGVGKLKPRDHFCALPTILINEGGLFESPYDFMVYLHLFAKSYGFGRNTCDMGLNELIQFTGLARNSVKKSLDRLVEQKWIRMVSNFEYGRVSRKWRIYSPYEKGLTPHPTFHLSDPSGEREQGAPETALATGSPGDTVIPRQSHEVIKTGSSSDPVTGSRRDPYKDKEINISKNNSLSPLPEKLQKYFAELKPQRKRESELRAFAEIRKDFSVEEIEAALLYLEQEGLPGGGECHSPMAYLAFAIGDLIAVVRKRQEVERVRAETVSRKSAEEQKRAEIEAAERAESERMEAAFARAFCGEVRQDEVIAELCRRHKFFISRGEAARAFAIGAWWNSLSDYERMTTF